MKHNGIIVLANSTHAEFYSYEPTKLTLLFDLKHPESSFKKSDLVSDGYGSFNNESAYQSRTDPKLLEAEKFASLVAKELEKHASNINEIYIIAPGHFQPLLKQKLSKATLTKISEYFAKDYTKLGIKDLEKHLSSLMGLSFDRGNLK